MYIQICIYLSLYTPTNTETGFSWVVFLFVVPYVQSFFPKRDAGSEVITNNYLERGCGAAIDGMAFACNDCYTLMYQQQQIKYLTTSQVATLFRVS